MLKTIVKAGQCFKSLDGHHIYKQYETFVLHILIRDPLPQFLVNTLDVDFITLKASFEGLEEITNDEWETTFDSIKAIMVGL